MLVNWEVFVLLTLALCRLLIFSDVPQDENGEHRAAITKPRLVQCRLDGTECRVIVTALTAAPQTLVIDVLDDLVLN